MRSATVGSDGGGLVARALGAGDAGALLALSAEAGWNQTADDWRLMLAHGEGFGLWTPDGAPVASALVLPYDGFAWLSMVLVSAPWRRRGLATGLVRRCLDRLGELGLPALLDATGAGLRTYRRLGFVGLSGYTRLEAERARLDAPADVSVRPMTTADLDAVVALEGRAFGARRPAVLAALLARAPAGAHVARAGGRACGLVLARDGRLATQLGPIVAPSPEIARALAAAALDRLDGRVFVDLPDAQGAFRAVLERAGFAAQRGLVRMARAGRDPGDAALRFALAGPELG